MTRAARDATGGFVPVKSSTCAELAAWTVRLRVRTLAAVGSVATLGINVGSKRGAVVSLRTCCVVAAECWAVRAGRTSNLLLRSFRAVVASVAGRVVWRPFKAEVTRRTDPAIIYFSGSGLVSVGAWGTHSWLLSGPNCWAVVASRAHVSSIVVDAGRVAVRSDGARQAVNRFTLAFVRVVSTSPTRDWVYRLLGAEIANRAHTRHAVVFEAVITRSARLAVGDISSACACVVQGIRTSNW